MGEPSASPTARPPFGRRLLAAAALLVGCDAEDEAGRSRALSDSPTEVTLVATDYAFDSPDTLASGWTTFRLANRGGQPHMAQLVRLSPGTSVDEYLAAYARAFRTAGTRPESGRRLGGPTVAAPGATTNATVYLEPGQYVWMCLFNLPDGVPHVVGHGMAAPFVVQGADSTRARREPEPDVVIRMTDYRFDVSGPLLSGRQVIRVENVGVESHEVSMMKLAAGKTIEDLKAWISRPTGALPTESGGIEGGGVTSLARGATAYFEIDLTPGEYVLLCFVTAPDGRPHIDHGMIQQVTVG